MRRLVGLLLIVVGVGALVALGRVARRRGLVRSLPPRLDDASRQRLSGAPVRLQSAGRDPGGTGPRGPASTVRRGSRRRSQPSPPGRRRRPSTRLGRWLAQLWAAPLSLAGLLVAAAGLALPRPRHGVLLATDARGLTGWALRRKGYSAMTWGHVVVSRLERPSARLLAHELAHVRQSERLGPVFVPVYLGLLASHGYRRHPLERAARERALAEAGAPR